MRWTPLLVAALASALVGCSSGATTAGTATQPARTPAPSAPSTPHPTRSHRPGPSTATSTTAPSTATDSTPAGAPTPSPRAPSGATTADAAQRVLARMTEEQRIGQLLMVDCPSTGVSSTTVTALRRYHVGSVILDGNSTLSVSATHAVTAKLQALASSPAKLFVATDQEGGLVRRLRGPGFSAIPSALDQGRLAPSTLQADATSWGRQLRHAGVNVDLAPVLDTVPADSPGNPPIGDLDREYGHDPTTVRRHGLAVARGLAAAGVDATVKHFPGLGRVSRNTDTDTGVTDSVTTRHDPYLAPFGAAAARHVPFVMVSTAIYTRIDPRTPAAFSRTVVTGMLRHDLGYTGVAISDDVGAARQVSGYPVGTRAVDFIAAGGDMVLTVDAGQAQEMTTALYVKAKRDPAFQRKVNAAALRVLAAKAARGLLR